MKRTLNEVINYNYYKIICESQGVSEELQPIAYNMAEQIKPYIDDSELIELFTNYNWDFNKKTFVKSNNICTESVYLELKNKLADEKASAQVYNRNVHIKNGKITIMLSLPKNYNKSVNELAYVIIHELQHIKQMYIHPSKDVLTLNKVNNYNYKHDDAIHAEIYYIYQLNQNNLRYINRYTNM